LVRRFVRSETSELGAADDLEKNRLVFAGRNRVTGSFHGVAEVLGCQRRAVAVLQPFPQVERDLGGVVVVFPGFSRSRYRFLVRVETGEALVGKSQDRDLDGIGALLRIHDIRVGVLMDP
jgi:hypothetical protein